VAYRSHSETRVPELDVGGTLTRFSDSGYFPSGVNPTSGEGGEEMIKKRLFVIVFCATALVGVSASGALAGEVKGPPGTPDNTNTTGALEHANSACAASGLNDFDPEEGQNVSQVQTAADSWKYYELPKGSPGTLGLCRGGGAGE